MKYRPFSRVMQLLLAVLLMACVSTLGGCEAEEDETGMWGFDERDDTFTFDDCDGLCDWTLYCQRNISGTNDPDQCAIICQEKVASKDPVWECWIECGSKEKGCDDLVDCLGDCNRNNT